MSDSSRSKGVLWQREKGHVSKSWRSKSQAHFLADFHLAAPFDCDFQQTSSQDNTRIYRHQRHQSRCRYALITLLRSISANEGVLQSHKSFRTKQKLAKAQKQNRPIPQWIRLRTGNTIRLVDNTPINYRKHTGSGVEKDKKTVTDMFAIQIQRKAKTLEKDKNRLVDNTRPKRRDVLSLHCDGLLLSMMAQRGG